MFFFLLKTGKGVYLPVLVDASHSGYILLYAGTEKHAG